MSEQMIPATASPRAARTLFCGLNIIETIPNPKPGIPATIAASGYHHTARETMPRTSDTIAMGMAGCAAGRLEMGAHEAFGSAQVAPISPRGWAPFGSICPSPGST